MSYLLDTHIFLWWLQDDPKLSAEAREVLQDSTNLVYISAATVWEIAIKVAVGKLEFKGSPAAEIEANGFVELRINARHAELAGKLPRHHDDPFDRMLVAQATAETLVLISGDSALTQYAVPTLS